MATIVEDFTPEYAERAPQCMRCGVSRRARVWFSGGAMLALALAVVVMVASGFLIKSSPDTGGYLMISGLTIAAASLSSCCGLKYCCRPRDEGYDQLAMTDDEEAVLM